MAEHLSYAPMVKVGTALEFAQRAGVANNIGFIGTRDDWTFQIADWVSDVWFASKLEALHAAQEALFTLFAEHIDQYCRELVANGRSSSALKLAELKGRWAASSPSQRKTLYEDESILCH
jgi:hypothetical protein